MTSVALALAVMMTPFGETVTPENAWREYPRPQMVRSNWTCLNGEWDWAITPTTNTCGRPKTWQGKILVPFAIESALSGVGRKLEPNEYLWYTRKIVCDPKPGERTLLHFDGVDYRAQVFIGHSEVTDVPHDGGQTPFTLDITDFVKPGENELTVCVWDPTEDFLQSRGKQCFDPHLCFYTRVSGIWQSVWMERVPEKHIKGYKVVPDIDNSTVRFDFDLVGEGEVAVKVDGLSSDHPINRPADHVVEIRIPDAELWSPEHPKLYTFTAKYGKDEIRGYFAMRKFSKAKDRNGDLRFFLNNEPYFILGTLDQGWWPDGLLTPPSDEAMAFDIRLLKDCGFNMMRKHIKVEPLRYYHLCDTMGLLVLQDMPSGGEWPYDYKYSPDIVKRYGLYRREWKEVVDTLFNVPSIVMWVPYNEGWTQHGEFETHSTLDWTRRYDPTRLVDGPSGYQDWEGGILRDVVRSPDGDRAKDKAKIAETAHRPAGECEAADAVDYHDYRGPAMPPLNDRRVSVLGEFGGLGHPVEGHLWKEQEGSWGYGGIEDTKTREGLERTYLGLMDRLGELAEKGLGGSVYTQTTDVEVEINGLVTYDRKVVKYNPAVLRRAHARVIERAKGNGGKNE